MKSKRSIPRLLALLTLLTAPVSSETFAGWLELDGSEHWLQVRTAGSTAWLVDFGADLREVPLVDLELDPSHVRFGYEAGIGRIAFAGTVGADGWSGQVTCPGFAPGSFELTRLHDVALEPFAAALGRYEDAGRPLWVVPRTFGGVRLVSWSGSRRTFSELAFDAWLPVAPDVYTSAVDPSPTTPQRPLSFTPTKLRLGGDDPRVVPRSSGSVRRASFQSGDLSLEGWLLIPPGPGPHPAIAYAHGSGYVSADSPFDLFTSLRLVEDLGLAVLRWDKRGVGRSQGDQARATYDDLAADIIAAHAWLKRQDGIDPERVGLGGLSQAPSWPIPLAAAEMDDVAFVIATSGSVTTIAETNIFAWSNRLRRNGFDERQVDAAARFYRGAFPLIVEHGPESWRYRDHLREHEAEPWFDSACALGGLDVPPSEPVLERWRRIWNVDPIESWRRVHCPVFQTWGADDRLVDAAVSATRMRDLTQATARSNFTSIVYPSPAGHAVGSEDTPTFFDDLARWFERSVPPPK